MVRASSQTVRVRKGFDPFQQMKSALATETPWESILDFALHPSFCGLKLYPRQQTLLKLIYLETENMTEYDFDVINGWAESFLDRSAPEGVQPDIWERVAYLKANGYRRFPHVQMVMGRRASKGVIGGILGAETVGFMYSLGDFQQHYGLPPGKDAYFMTYATNMVQAKRFQFADIRSTIERCQYLQPAISTNKEYTLTLRTPADERRLLELERSGVPIEREFASLQCVAMTSNSASGRGAAAFGLAFDEMAHAITGTDSTKSSESTYAATTPALDQFGKDSLVYIP